MKRILAVIALLGLSTAAWAQYQNEYMGSSIYDRYVTFNISARYGVALPMGGQQGYIDRISPTNLALDGEWLFPKRFSIGLKTGYQYTHQRLPRQVYDYDSQSISAVQTRTLSVIPAMVSLSYYFADNAAAIRPYIQMAGGGAYIDYTNYFGPLADQKNGFKGAIAPAIGLKFYGKREQGLGAEVQAQYQNVFFNYDLLKNSAPSLMLSAGIIYRWY
ncbi:OmpW family outer membrane protein [Spirosoma panaciterrae]|uniref:OmpW family outer membrane protein n=1 Tax=Spirosoma panaciterrae TaxID=496058 RepID=UPI00036B15F0|nr:OmpW family outer membrane protein [Spirosoma panaciterrae]